MNIIEKADKYADGKANEAITKAIAQAYLDGYRDGYNDREAEIPEDFRDNKTTYIDLGLPSRTLWSEDYEKDGDDCLYLPYERAEYMKLPTSEQLNELLTECKFEIEWLNNQTSYITQVKCVGPNGNILRFRRTGKYETDDLISSYDIYFWIEDLGDSTSKNAANFYSQNERSSMQSCIRTMRGVFSGYRLPVRLVR
jgi:hypothetical protein